MSAHASQPGLGSTPNETVAEHAIEDASGQAESLMSKSMRQGNGSYELVLSAVALGLIGFALDRRVGTVPIFMLAFTLLGFAGAAISIYYRYRNQIARLQAETAALQQRRLQQTTKPRRERAAS